MVKHRYIVLSFILGIATIVALMAFGPRIKFKVLANESNNLYIVFNQPAYVPGDTIFFSGYYFFNNRLVDGKDIIRTVLINKEGETILQNRFRFSDGTGSGNIVLPGEMTPGNYYLYAQSENQPAVNMRWFVNEILVEGEKKVDHLPEFIRAVDDGKEIEINLEKNIYAPREEVKVGVKSFGQNKSIIASVSVFKENLFATGKNGASIYSSNSILVSNDLPQKASPNPVYFKGRVLNAKKDKNAKGGVKILFYLERNDFAYSVNSDFDGYFEYPLFKDFGDEKIYYRIFQNGRRQRDLSLELTNSHPKPENYQGTTSNVNDPYYQYASDQNYILRSYNYYYNKNASVSIRPVQRDFDCDDEIVLSKFEAFPTMGEVFINIVPNVRYLKRKGKERVEILLNKTSTFSEDDPLFIVNNIVTDSMDYVMNLFPEDVKRIGVLRSEQKLNRFGELGENGIILVELNDPKAVTPLNNNTLEVVGITKAIPFRKVQYNRDNLESRIPDLRANLYWNPKFIISGNEGTTLSFFTSDDTGYYVIEVFGVTSDGEKFSHRQRLLVSSE